MIAPDPGESREAEDARGAETRPRLTILTGVTGFLGRNLLSALLEDDPESRVWAIVRATERQSAGQRLAELLARMYPDEAQRRDAAERVDVIEGDLARAAPRLDGERRRRLADHSCWIIHGAATVTLDHSLEVAREVNVGGTRRMLEFAEEIARMGALERFAYVGTAFVAGTRSGVILEDELDEGQSFRNTYEQSKCEAEALVRSWADRLPVSLFRPSIIAGHSKTGITTSFKTIYWPLKVFTRGIVLCIPGDPGAFYDLVPVDFVADALLHILDREDSVGRCYHLTASRTIRLDRAVRFTADFFGIRRIPPFVPPRLFYPIVRPLLYLLLWGRWRGVLVQSRVLVPYLTCRLEFDNRNSLAALAGSGLTPPDVEKYLETVYRYALETGFARRRGSRMAGPR